jgi:hypothetical protein
MGWIENVWRRRKGETTDDQASRAPEPDEPIAEELEEEAHEARDDQAIEEPRPPGG